MQSIVKFNGNILLTAFCGGALTMMIVMCACMLFTATFIPSAVPLTIISAAIFGPALIGVGTGVTAMKLTSKKMLLIGGPVEQDVPDLTVATTNQVGQSSTHEE
jgi:hypothetical protein